MTHPKLQVTLKNFQRKWPINQDSIRSYLRTTWTEIYNAGVSLAKSGSGRRDTGDPSIPVEVTIVFLNDRQIRDYNKRYRNKDYPTDVLSFPVNEIHDTVYYLGDILISMERTALQAHEKGHRLVRELKILLLHGVLHLLEYDHEVDQGQMERLERRLRRTVL